MSMHSRFLQQAGWTEELRRYLFSMAGIESAQKVLEVGCGTGAILSTLPQAEDRVSFGVDIDYGQLLQTSSYASSARLAQADAYHLPFPDNTFGIVFCHFLLLWLQLPLTALAEMMRVCKPGGWVLAAAEPDYGGRIDYPQALEVIGRWQARELEIQGANPDCGRRIFAWFNACGFKQVVSGVMGGQWSHPAGEDWQSEWAQLRADLTGKLSPQEFQSIYEIELQARKIGERILFVPTFYAAGQKI